MLALGEVEGVRRLVAPPLRFTLVGDVRQHGIDAGGLRGEADGGREAVGQLHRPLFARLVLDGLLHHVHGVGGRACEVPVEFAGLDGGAVILVGVEGDGVLLPAHDAGLELRGVLVFGLVGTGRLVGFEQGVAFAVHGDVCPGGQGGARVAVPRQLDVVGGHQLFVEDGLLRDDGRGDGLAGE